ncbi:hypothetical protein RRG08_043461 [Elysia crispata]|uniref:Uncharacterized protein n=1 Tax=Elysia crispata TaxID=231223 RepID=A0AAE0XQ79_9GAST|nr:hypothetical protein RRG08_043461 [Elysia crispata]
MKLPATTTTQGTAMNRTVVTGHSTVSATTQPSAAKLRLNPAGTTRQMLQVTCTKLQQYDTVRHNNAVATRNYDYNCGIEITATAIRQLQLENPLSLGGDARQLQPELRATTKLQ